MTDNSDQIQLELKYVNASGASKTMVVAIRNDLELDYEGIYSVFEAVDWTVFHASRYDLPSPARFDYEWQADGEDHCMVDLCELIHGPIQTVDAWSEHPISVIASYIREGGQPNFAESEKKALKAEIKRLIALDRQA
ncbi:hypothetical protein [Vibrio owensii]|uniref:hypothetical protein n=1 Tax=Vibrio owensii TaxID=696485 RepID=UPI0018F1716A|nr:hypothetical protein [Vibrio owensii]